MRVFTDQLNETQKAHFVSDEPYVFSEALLKYLKKHATDVTYVSKFDKESYDTTSFLIIAKKRFTKTEIEKLAKLQSKTLVITQNKTLFSNLTKTFSSKKYKHLRFAHIDLDEKDTETIENLMWFFLGRGKDRSIDLVKSSKPPKPKPPKKHFKLDLTKRQKWFFGLVVLLIIQFAFVIPLLGTGIYIRKAGQHLQNAEIEAAQKDIDRAKPLFAATQNTYKISRPLFLFFFLSLVPENVISIEENAITFIDTSIDTYDKARTVSSLITKTGKSPDELNKVKVTISQLNTNIDTLAKSSGNLKELLDYRFESAQKVRAQFEKANAHLQTVQKLAQHSDTLLGGKAPQKYLLFFYNNMEQRPGGGFIGSFATATFSNYTLEDFEVFDVYDADGQLKAHVPPPRPIRDHLDQPNWFLRDSNFAPDFPENVENAEFFLEKELGLDDFDGYIGITTTGLTYILDAFGEIRVPDFNETITKDNFYMKAQLQSEGNFFPGSTQKKSYLSTIGRTLIFSLEDASPVALGANLKKGFDEKHFIFLSNHDDIQKDIDSLRWSGKTSLPQCLTGPENCVINHVFSIDANLGVNKANYYVNKSIRLLTTVDEDGSIDNFLATTMINNSPSNVFPGGTYKNYYQIYIPSGSDVTSVDIDGRRIRNFDEKSTGYFKIIGLVVEVPPKKSATVTVAYDLAETIPVGNKSYQLVVQKQIGSFNYDFAFELNLPDNIIAVDQNFPSLAKPGSVVYNTDLSTDRIFVIDLVREK